MKALVMVSDYAWGAMPRQGHQTLLTEFPLEKWPEGFTFRDYPRIRRHLDLPGAVWAKLTALARLNGLRGAYYEYLERDPPEAWLPGLAIEAIGQRLAETGLSRDIGKGPSEPRRHRAQRTGYAVRLDREGYFITEGSWRAIPTPRKEYLDSFRLLSGERPLLQKLAREWDPAQGIPRRVDLLEITRKRFLRWADSAQLEWGSERARVASIIEAIGRINYLADQREPSIITEEIDNAAANLRRFQARTTSEDLP